MPYSYHIRYNYNTWAPSEMMNLSSKPFMGHSKHGPESLGIDEDIYNFTDEDEDLMNRDLQDEE